jgi:hypothetical protein
MNPHSPSNTPSAQPRPDHGYKLVVATAVNNDDILRTNLAASPMLRDGRFPLIIKRGYNSAAKAYNEVLDQTDADAVVFVHQDIYLPSGWDKRLLDAIGHVESLGKPWGVLGVLGVSDDSRLHGCIWCGANEKQFGGPLPAPKPVTSIDEVVIVVNRKSKARFDPQLQGYHLYATDIILNAKQMGLQSYAFYAPVIHNSLPTRWMNASYRQAYDFMRAKWRPDLPIPTMNVPLTNSPWPFWRVKIHQYRTLWRLWSQGKANRKRYDAPAAVAKQLGYE